MRLRRMKKNNGLIIKRFFDELGENGDFFDYSGKMPQLMIHTECVPQGDVPWWHIASLMLWNCMGVLIQSIIIWYRWPDSNRHSLRHHHLKVACLPIPPHRLKSCDLRVPLKIQIPVIPAKTGIHKSLTSRLFQNPGFPPSREWRIIRGSIAVF